MNIIYKKAVATDIPVIAGLADRIWRKHYPDIITREQIDYMLKNMYSPANLLQQMNEGHKYTLVYTGEKPVGYSSISTKDDKNYFLHKFYVEIADQRKGIGSKLLDHVLKELGSAQTVELTVNRKNYKAINFYFKKGFVIKEVADFDIGNGFFMNDFVMIKKVNG
ncbi:MAG: GNAT family N-acetyltransferase [Bacteroidota bacterium]